MKLLIIQQKMIGDVLTTSILFEALKAAHPNAELHYVINTHTFPVVENNPYIDKFLFVTPEIEQSKIKFYTFLKSIRHEHYDAVVDVYGKLSSALISYFSKAKIKSAYHKSYTAFIYNKTIDRLTSPKHNSSLAIENRMRLIECLDVPFKSYNPKIYLTDQEVQDAKQYLFQSGIDLSKILFMISVLGSNSIKTYPFEYMAKLLDTIVETNPEAQLLFNYIPKQKEDAKAIYDYCNSQTQQQIFFNVFGKSLREFLAITKHCTALIGNEGGANNMAKALDIPTFTIFSPYLNKQNWFGENETNQHVAVHLLDTLNYTIEEAKAHPEMYYKKFKPEFISPILKTFVTNLS
ncbi:glycosyltransferase family 9 protein [Psychroserpens algicola]|uniref:Glycosyltransferase family 9 protein n=1 Tax=Psychroserpens algicola TaxID=1719034 RepID=A0ABT0HCA7_9FLAO|nr:glycosyltransferase family 9 protein [Psychroserpens algicola]MCK8481981.1 glycosyltransferase family 9 protein [Psychroserpens algicola]